ncbi:MAG: Type 1 glutamine amidotransferase-like domain-containing protein [Candidatus Shapirobacteria bacterium]
MKLLLTSTGLEGKVKDFFINLIDKPPQQLNLAFIPTAADPYSDKWFMEKDLENLKNIGFKVTVVDLKDNPQTIKTKLENSQIIYVGGGNTFYLLHWVCQSKLDTYLKDLLANNRYYVGASAGSVLVGPDIALSGWDPGWDTNDVGLTDTSGLNFVPFAVSPHFTEKKRMVLESHSVNYPVIPITDQQAIYSNDDDWQLVGDGENINLKHHG